MNVPGKIIVVTGASYGIGEATVKLLAHKGAKVALVARSTERIKAIAAGLQDAFTVTADMSKEQEVRGMIDAVREHYGRIDVLVNNAGQGYGAPIEQIETEKLRYLYDLNVIGPLVAMQAAIPVMRRQGGGAIVNVSSGTSLMAIPNVGGYSSSKRALNGISLTAHAELAKENITVSVVYPYITESGFYKNALTAAGKARGHIQVHGNMPPADTSEYVAEKILAAIESGAAEIYVHEWMKNPPAR